MQQILKGCHYLHRNKIMHRDIKSANILLDDNGVVQLADFGLGRRTRFDNVYTYKVVTLWYRAPELLLGCKCYNHKIDVWSIGCVFAEFLLGEILFKKDTEYAIVQKIYQVCGGLTQNEYTDEYLKNCVYHQDMKPKKSYKEGIENYIKNINPDVDASCVEFLKALIQLNPYKRLSCEQALDHQFFKQDPLPCKPEEIHKLDFQFHEMFRDRSLKIQRGEKGGKDNNVNSKARERERGWSQQEQNRKKAKDAGEFPLASSSLNTSSSTKVYNPNNKHSSSSINHHYRQDSSTNYQQNGHFKGDYYSSKDYKKNPKLGDSSIPTSKRPPQPIYFNNPTGNKPLISQTSQQAYHHRSSSSSYHNEPYNSQERRNLYLNTTTDQRQQHKYQRHSSSSHHGKRSSPSRDDRGYNPRKSTYQRYSSDEDSSSSQSSSGSSSSSLHDRNRNYHSRKDHYRYDRDHDYYDHHSRSRDYNKKYSDKHIRQRSPQRSPRSKRYSAHPSDHYQATGKYISGGGSSSAHYNKSGNTETIKISIGPSIVGDTNGISSGDKYSSSRYLGSGDASYQRRADRSKDRSTERDHHHKYVVDDTNKKHHYGDGKYNSSRHYVKQSRDQGDSYRDSHHHRDSRDRHYRDHRDSHHLDRDRDHRVRDNPKDIIVTDYPYHNRKSSSSYTSAAAVAAQSTTTSYRPIDKYTKARNHYQPTYKKSNNNNNNNHHHYQQEKNKINGFKKPTTTFSSSYHDRDFSKRKDETIVIVNKIDEEKQKMVTEY